MICILLSSYNGSHYIADFLKSIKEQSDSNWFLIVRDDNSSDNTKEIIETFVLENQARAELLHNDKNLGAMGSFLKLLEYAIDKNDCEYIMFADQDDVWLNDKVAKAHAKIKHLKSMYGYDTPLLVHTDLVVVDGSLSTLDNSFWHYERIDPSKNSLNRLLIQNTITGCTVIINKSLAKMAAPIPDKAIMHDWWIGLVAAKFGKIGYIDEVTMLYRQHGANDTGAKKFSYMQIVKKAFLIFQKKDILNKNIEQAKAFLRQYEDNLGESDKRMLTDFCNIKEYSFWKKRYILFRHRLFKQGIIRNIGLLLRA